MEKVAKQWWIDKNKILGSSNPPISNLKELYQQGFRTIVSFLDGKEQIPHYNITKVREMGFRFASIPIKDFTAPTAEQYSFFTSVTKERLKRGKIVMHCWGGSGRTGTMGAAYWISKGFSAEEAIDKVREVKPCAVETEGQERSLEKLEDALYGSGASSYTRCMFKLRKLWRKLVRRYFS